MILFFNVSPRCCGRMVQRSEGYDPYRACTYATKEAFSMILLLLLFILFFVICWKLFTFTLKIGWTLLKFMFALALPLLIVFLILAFALAAVL